jgi:class 3 adenylate cyclase
LDPNVCNSRLSYLLSFFRAQLASDGFDIKSLEAKAPLSLPGKFDKFKLLPKYDHKFSGKFNFMEFGNFKAKVFSNYIGSKDLSTEKLACLIVGFDKRLMDQYLLRKLLYLNNQHSEKVFLSSKSASGLKFLPTNNALQKMLKAINLTGGDFTKDLQWKNQTYLAMGKPIPGIEIAALAVTRLQKSKNEKWYLAFLALMFIVSLYNSREMFNLLIISFLQPIKQLIVSVQKVTNGDYSKLNNKVENDELSLLQNDLNKLAQGLKEKAEMQNYLSDDLVENSSKNSEIKVEKKNAVVLFAGIRNFSKIEKDSTPELAMEIMNSFLACCEKNVRKNSGEIDKYIGDTAMAVFYDREGSEKEENAIQAAIEIQKEILSSHTINSESISNFDFGIGLAGGDLIAGHIGSLRKRLDYTIIGDTVNLAARLEKLAGQERKGQILAEKGLLKKLHKTFSFKEVELPSIKGKKQRVSAVTVLGKNIS